MKTYEQAHTAATGRGPNRRRADEELFTLDPGSVCAVRAFFISSSTRRNCGERLAEALGYVYELGTNAVLHVAPPRGGER